MWWETCQTSAQHGVLAATVQGIALFVAWNHKPANIHLFLFCGLKPSSWLVSGISDTIELCFCFHSATKCLAAQMKCDVKTLFISFLFSCCKPCSHTKVCILKVCFPSAVYTLHMADCGSRIAFREWMKRKKDTHHRMFAMLSSLTWKVERCSVKTSLASIYPTKLKPPGVVCAQKEHLDWSWFNVVATFYSPLKTRHRQRSKCKENSPIILFLLFQQNKVS